jgi:hypothetical protein
VLPQVDRLARSATQAIPVIVKKTAPLAMLAIASVKQQLSVHKPALYVL